VAAAARLYLRPGMTVADVTFGRGVFWRKADLSRVTLLASDLHHADPERRHDFRRLPYADGTLNVVVLDPPYLHDVGAGREFFERNYRNRTTTAGHSHEDIVGLYRDGLAEAKRVLKVGGQVWVKCKDETASGVQRRTSIEVYQLALQLGLVD